MAFRFGQKPTKTVIEEVARNEPSLDKLDLTKSASFCMKAADNTVALCEALRSNTRVRTLILRECEIVDSGAQALADMLKENHSIEELDLQQNHITTRGVNALASGIAQNKGLQTLNLLNQTQKLLGEEVVEHFIDAFSTNITLTKVMWKTDSRRTWELSSFITRNVSIQKAIASGMEHSHLLPPALRDGAAPSSAPEQGEKAPSVPSAAPPADASPAPVSAAKPPPAEAPPAMPAASPSRGEAAAVPAETVAAPAMAEVEAPVATGGSTVSPVSTREPPPATEDSKAASAPVGDAGADAELTGTEAAVDSSTSPAIAEPDAADAKDGPELASAPAEGAAAPGEDAATAEDEGVAAPGEDAAPVEQK